MLDGQGSELEIAGVQTRERERLTIIRDYITIAIYLGGVSNENSLPSPPRKSRHIIGEKAPQQWLACGRNVEERKRYRFGQVVFIRDGVHPC